MIGKFQSHDSNLSIFYQIQQSMFTPNKRKSKTCKQIYDCFEPVEFFYGSEGMQELINQTSQSQYEKQNVAKDILIQLGQSQYFLHQKKVAKNFPLTIDSWATNLPFTRVENRPNRIEQNNFIFARNTRSVTSGVKNKQQTEESNVRKLKQALKKLESPEKERNRTRKMSANKNQILQSLLSKRKIETKVGDLIRLKQTENMKVDRSSANFHTRKISTSLDHQSRRDRSSNHEPLGEHSKLQNQLFNFQYREARKNRTLKGLLS